MNHKDYGIGEREIKFRAWNVNGKEMIKSPHFSLNPSGLPDTSLNDFFEYYTKSQFLFMQNTGLKDKSGKEIYEGDILKFIFDGEECFTCPVSWRNDMSMWRADIGLGLNTIQPEDAWLPDTYEVAGNIFENPELLTPSNKEDE